MTKHKVTKKIPKSYESICDNVGNYKNNDKNANTFGIESNYKTTN